MVDDPPRRLVWATEPDRPEVHLPESVVDLLEADVQLGEDVAHVHPPAAPANAAVATHAPHFIMPRIRDRQERGGVRPRGRLVQTCGQALAEGFVPPLRVVALAEPVKAALLGRQRARGGRAVSACPPPHRCRRRPALPTKAENDLLHPLQEVASLMKAPSRLGS